MGGPAEQAQIIRIFFQRKIRTQPLGQHDHAREIRLLDREENSSRAREALVSLGQEESAGKRRGPHTSCTVCSASTKALQNRWCAHYRNHPGPQQYKARKHSSQTSAIGAAHKGSCQEHEAFLTLDRYLSTTPLFPYSFSLNASLILSGHANLNIPHISCSI